MLNTKLAIDLSFLLDVPPALLHYVLCPLRLFNDEVETLSLSTHSSRVLYDVRIFNSR